MHEQPALPASPEMIALYITTRAECWKVNTLTRNLTASSIAHQMADHPSATQHAAVRTVIHGIRRTEGVTQQVKAPAVTADTRRTVEMLPEGLLGIRDR